MGKLSEMLGSRLKELRKKKGLRQEDMEDLGINYRYYQKIESGKANITLSTIEKIADALEIDPAELFVMPLHRSGDVNRLAASLGEIIKKNDKKAIRKLDLFIKEIL